LNYIATRKPRNLTHLILISAPIDMTLHEQEKEQLVKQLSQQDQLVLLQHDSNCSNSAASATASNELPLSPSSPPAAKKLRQDSQLQREDQKDSHTKVNKHDLQQAMMHYFDKFVYYKHNSKELEGKQNQEEQAQEVQQQASKLDNDEDKEEDEDFSATTSIHPLLVKSLMCESDFVQLVMMGPKVSKTDCFGCKVIKILIFKFVGATENDR